MAEIKDINVENNKVVFTFKNDFIGNKVIVTLTNRYYVVLQSRWNFEHMEIENCFLKLGAKGSYLGERKSPNDDYVYDVWDLNKIFPNVQFNDNTKELETLNSN